VTTEHFTLQGARAAAITESTSRATIFIGSVSAGLIALGLIATATRIGTTFYAFGLILLWTLSFLGLVTFDRVLQSGIEELHYAERIARLRAYYFDFAQRVLASLPDDRRNDRHGHRGPDRLCRGPARHHRRWPLGGRRVCHRRGGERRCLGGTDVVPVFGLCAGPPAAAL
jgi:hypothetical protein